jgi:myosin heavy subunit
LINETNSSVHLAWQIPRGILLTPENKYSPGNTADTGRSDSFVFIKGLSRKRKELEQVVSKAKEDMVREEQKRIEILRKNAEKQLAALEEELNRDIFHTRSKHRKRKQEQETDLEREVNLDELKKKAEEAMDEKERVIASIDSLSASHKERHREDIDQWVREAEAQLQKVLKEQEAARNEYEKLLLTRSKSGDEDLQNELVELEEEFRRKRKDLKKDQEKSIENEKRVANEKIKEVNDKLLQGFKKLHEELLAYLEKHFYTSARPDPGSMKAAIDEVESLLSSISGVEMEMAVSQVKTSHSIMEMQFRNEKEHMMKEMNRIETHSQELANKEKEHLSRIEDLTARNKELTKEKDSIRREMEVLREIDQRRRRDAAKEKKKEPKTGTADEVEKKEGVSPKEKLTPARAALKNASAVKKAVVVETKTRSVEPPAEVAPVTVRCLNCDTPIEVGDETRPVNISCLNCGQESTLDADNKLTSLGDPGDLDDIPATTPRKIKIPRKTDAVPGKSKRKIVLKRKSTTKTTASSSRGGGKSGVAGVGGFNEEEGGIKTISCSSCGRIHNVPADWTQKIACTCGRWLRTKGG